MSLKYSGTERVSCDNPQRNDQIIGIKGYKECHNINGEWNFRLREFCTEKGKLFLYSRFKGGWRLECELVLYCLLKWNGNGVTMELKRLIEVLVTSCKPVSMKSMPSCYPYHITAISY